MDLTPAPQHPQPYDGGLFLYGKNDFEPYLNKNVYTSISIIWWDYF